MQFLGSNRRLRETATGGAWSKAKATVLLASGGVYTEGLPIRERDIATQYLRLILNLIGISDVTMVAGGGAKAVDLREQTMDGFLAKLQPEIAQAARS